MAMFSQYQQHSQPYYHIQYSQPDNNQNQFNYHKPGTGLYSGNTLNQFMPNQYQMHKPYNMHMSQNQYPPQMYQDYQMGMHPNMTLAQNHFQQDDSTYFMRAAVSQGLDVNDKQAFQGFINQFEQEYKLKQKRGSPTRSQSHPQLSRSFEEQKNNGQFERSRSKSPSPFDDNLMRQSYGASFNARPTGGIQNYQDFLPSTIEKQRAMYNDTLANGSSRFLMQDQKNNPLNYKDMKSRERSPNQLPNQVSMDSPSKQQHVQMLANQMPPYQQRVDLNVINQLGGMQDTIGPMKRSLEQYELNRQPYQTLDMNRQYNQGDSQIYQQSPFDSMGAQFNQTLSQYQYGAQHYNDQRERVIQILTQPQIKTTLTSSSYMRQLREQSLRGIQNWEHVLNMYKEKKFKEDEEKKNQDQNQKGGPVGGRYGSKTTISSSSYMIRH